MKYYLICIFLSAISLNSLVASDTLRSGFENPPPSAKARTWWHWMDGNVTKVGITADLEAMKNVGIQEAQILNVGLGFPQGPATYLSEEWLDLFHFAAKEAKRLNLELGFHNGAGWSSSGGPWITPEHAMQTLVFSEVAIEGPNTYRDKIPQPETRLDYYRDIAVLAFPKPKSAVRIDGLDYKNLSGRIRNHLDPDLKQIPDSALVFTSDIIDLTSELTKDGFLEWDAPAGAWIILRIGHTPTGRMNKPAPSGGRGLECNKMSREAVDEFWEGGIHPILEKLGPLVGSVLTNCLIDSYEVGSANWTGGLDKSFKQLRGYDCFSYLPCLAGYYVESGEISERFLWDFRRTIGDMIAENYYAYFRDLCHTHQLAFSIEPYWGPFDNMQVGETGDIVMSEFWSGGLPFFDSPKFVASIAKLNGSSIVGAEAFTDQGGWLHHPATLKSIGDRAWAQGINRFIFHTYVHQPWNVPPGLTLGSFGIDFNRLNTWWDQGKGFMEYIGRSQFLLQQGISVADVLVFTGEASPNDALLMPEIKALGYDYDLIGANKIKSLTLKDGLIYTSTGAGYRALVLPNTKYITPETLQKLEELAGAGAIIFSAKPQKSPSLQNYPDCDQQISQLTEKLWGGDFIKDASILDFLRDGALPPDFSVKNNGDGINYIHRKTKKADIYFVANNQKENRQELCRFRVSGKQPELWNAESCEIKNAPVWQDHGNGTTSILMEFEAEGSVFVVFRKPVNSSEHIVNTTVELIPQIIEPLPNLEIIKAEYGTFLPEGLLDVTKIVLDSVQGDRLNMYAIKNNLCSYDPAQGYIKELRVEYMIGDTLFEASALEKEPINIDAQGRGQLKILRAVFGKFDRGTPGIPAHYPAHDVTNKIIEMVASGKLKILVDESLVDSKSVDGNQKALRITFTAAGEVRTLSIPEGGKLTLAQETPEPAFVFEKGELNWQTPFAGKMTYSTSSGKTKTVKVKSVPDPIEIDGSWEVNFPSNSGNAESVSFDSLASWSSSSSEEIRYFSGTATYSNKFIIPRRLIQSGNALELDLGSVHVIAEVTMNGKNIGLLWKAPFRINIDDFVHIGENTLELKITNLWPNRIIGDEHLSLDYERKGRGIKQWPEWLENPVNRPSESKTFTGYKHWEKDSELQSSGLLGPVIIRPYVGVQLLD